jgi:serine/threonine protein kinase
MHRDLKPNNILISLSERDPATNTIIAHAKICDFGFARTFSYPLGHYTELISVLAYRPPEILMNVKQYSCAVDVWSLGCIWAELIEKRRLFNKNSEIDQIFKIFEALGTPTNETWAGVESL